MTLRAPKFAVLVLVAAALCPGGCTDGTIERVNILPGAGLGDPELDGGPSQPSDMDADAPDAAPPCEGDDCPVCGDGEREGAEECDDGNRQRDDGCSARCRLEEVVPPAPCGDGVQTEAEECDDGNIVSGDGCDEQCRMERCGNRRVDAREECDPPAQDSCDELCLRLLPNCGDGTQQADEGEQCDDANDVSGDGCHACRFECGNGKLERSIGEECEPLFALEGTCDAVTCKRLPACGDGEVQAEVGEECDPSDGVTCINCEVHVIPAPDAGDECVPLPAPAVAVTNGAFEADVAGWTPRARITTARAPEGAGSLRTVFEALEGSDSGYEISGAYQCVFVTPGAEYLLKLKYQIPTVVADEVSPSLILREYANQDCTGASNPVSGPVLGSARGAWVERQGPVGIGPNGRSLFLQLSVVKPRNVEGAVLWDDIELGGSTGGARCGNCVVDPSQDETCDDGNRDEGDGCDDSCQLEGCGDGVVSGAEDCDDGNTIFGDSSDQCTPTCGTKSACDTCAATSCALELDPCLNLTGEAAGGPGAGKARSTLCGELRACVHSTGCDGDTAIAASSELATGRFLEHCYCGTAGQDCFEPGAANGSCRAEVEAALETTNPVEVLARVGGSQAGYPIFASLNDLRVCESAMCAAQCTTALECGDGSKQDRPASFAASYKLRVGTTLVACDDALTDTGVGCSIEECDDGNDSGGDGCDADCFEEVCGNYIKQGAEECDDGNTISDDGCSAACIAEYVCGDDTRDERFEECDPPASGTLCSEAQYDADATQCACDASCQRTVCGNGVIQLPEQCDPPGPACSETCAVVEDECTACIRRIDTNAAGANGCAGKQWLEGEPTFPGYELGCSNNQACLDAWTCYWRSSCATASLFGPSVCYCGDVSAEVCTAAGYVATGECKDEIAAAFEEQFQYSVPNNGAVLEAFENSLLNVPPGGYGAFFASYDLAYNCLGPGANDTSQLHSRLVATGLSEADATVCVDKCFP